MNNQANQQDVVAWEVTGNGVRPGLFTSKPEWAVEDAAYTVRALKYAESIELTSGTLDGVSRLNSQQSEYECPDQVQRYDMDKFRGHLVSHPDGEWVHIDQHTYIVGRLKQLLRNVRATLHFSSEDVLAIDAALREDEE